MTPYIGKNDLVAEIKRQLFAIDKCPKLTDTQIAVLEGNKIVLTKLLSFIDTLEVKEVDLEKEIYDAEKRFGDIDEMGGYRILIFDDEFRDILRYFFELGLQRAMGEPDNIYNNTLNNPKITIGTKIRSKTNPNIILSIISNDCHDDEFECSNGSVLSLKQIEKYYDIIS